MTERDERDRPVPGSEDVGAWLLGALDETEAAAFAAELERSDELREQVARLQPVADALPMGAEQMAAPPELRSRIMDTVRREAQLTRAAAGEPAPEHAAEPEAAPGRSRWRMPFGLRPALVGGLAAGVLAIGIGAIVVSSGSDSGAPGVTVQAKVTVPGASGSLISHGEGGGHLELTGMPAPAPGHIYEVWVIRDGQAAPAQAALFAPNGDGHSTVNVSDPLATGDVIAVTEEPSGGSQQPTAKPIVTAPV